MSISYHILYQIVRYQKIASIKSKIEMRIKMIIAKLYGGLGNQMFIYAFSRLLQSYYKEPIRLNQFELIYNEVSVTKRNYELGCFKLNHNVKLLNQKESEFWEFLLRIKKRHVPEKIECYNLYKQFAKTGLYTSTLLYQYYNFVYTNHRLKFIDGYFMSWKYYESIKPILQKDFRFKFPPSLSNKNLLKEIKESNAVCVHIRRGDYISKDFRRTNALCGESYYSQAIKKLSSQLTNPIFFIFSNSSSDIKWIQTNYHFSNCNIRYVDLDNPGYEDLRLMMNCKHFILANSSFSWWAQYLCKYKEKLVVAPNVWLQHPEQNYITPNMPNWMIIPYKPDKL